MPATESEVVANDEVKEIISLLSSEEGIAAGYLAPLTRAEPFVPPLAKMLVQSALMSGLSPDVVRNVYESVRSIREELGLSPAPEYDELMQGDQIAENPEMLGERTFKPRLSEGVFSERATRDISQRQAPKKLPRTSPWRRCFLGRQKRTNSADDK